MAEAAKKTKLPKGRHQSQIKRERQSLKRADRNRGVRSEVKTYVKKVLAAIEAKDANVKDILKAASRVIQKAVGKGILHKNNAARKISNLASKVAKLAA